MIRRSILKALAFSAISLPMLMTTPAVQAQDAQTVDIGVLLSMTGSLGRGGNNVVLGMQTALEEVNALSPSRQFRLVIEDDESSPQAAMDGIRKLVDVDKVPVVLGTVGSATTIPTASYSLSKNIPHVGLTASSPDVRSLGKGYFSIIATDEVMGAALAKFAMEDTGKKKVGIIVANDAYGVGLARRMQEAVTANGGEVVSEVRYEAGQPDYRAELQRLFSPKPEIVLAVSWGDNARLLTKQAYEMGLMQTVQGAWYQPYPAEIVNACIAEACEDVKGLDIAADRGERFQQLKTSLETRVGSDVVIDWFIGVGYDAVWVTALAVDLANSAEPAAISAALPKAFEIYRGVSDADMSVDADGIQHNQEYGSFVIKAGKLEPYTAH